MSILWDLTYLAIKIDYKVPSPESYQTQCTDHFQDQLEFSRVYLTLKWYWIKSYIPG